ncbi:MAG: YihY/virulence factor BrkB family protein [Culicoidibacterales bacterium]
MFENFQLFWKKSSADQLGLLSAQIAYTLLLALFPFFILLIIILNTFQINPELIQNIFVSILPETTYELVVSVLLETTSEATRLFTPLTFVAFISMAAGLMPLLHALNRIYGIQEKRCYPRQYITSFLGTIFLMTGIVASLIFSIIDIYLWSFLVNLIPFLEQYTLIYQIIQQVIPALLFVTSLTLIFFVLPYEHRGLKHAFIAAIFSTVFWLVATTGFSFYVTNISTKYSQLYGGLAAVIALITWLYVTAFTLLWGIECSNAIFLHQPLQTNNFLKQIDTLWEFIGSLPNKLKQRYLK